MSKQLLFKQHAHLRVCEWLKFVGALLAILAITQTGSSQTVAEPNEPTQLQPALQVQSDTAASGFAGGITSNDFIPLMDLIQSVIKTDTWQDNGGEGTLIDYPAGVYADAALAVASVRNNLQPSLHPRLKTPTNSSVNETSKLRTISLNRIEDAIAAAANTGRPLSEELQNLAGIYRIDYVFIDEQNDDVLIAGPAGAWRTNTSGRAVSVESGFPTLQLDDLIVCLMNAFTDDGKFGCTIVPKPSALKSAQKFLASTTKMGTGRKWRESLRAAVGKQEVIVHGVSPDSGVAETIVDADYLMKKIGMGLEPSIDQCPSYFDRVEDNPAAAKDQTLIRWWFTMAYDALVKDANDRVFQFSGNSIKVLSENELLDQQGRRVHTGVSDDPTAGFAEDFSQHIERLSEKHPVFASLKNVFDLALVANIVKKYDVRNRLKWERRFGAESADSVPNSNERTQYVLASHEYNSEVDSIMNFETFNFKKGGKRFRRTMVGVSGGVEFDFSRLLKNLKIAEQSQSQFPQMLLVNASKPHLQNQSIVWWWD